MINYDSPAALRAFLEERGLAMRKRYGQNFLVKAEARRALVDALGAQAGDAVWEIGPGLGSMTSLLLERGLALSAFEIDTGFIAVLKEEFGALPHFTLIEGDVLKTWKQAAPAPFLLGNLPYTIGAALLGDMIEGGRIFDRMVVTVQKETALRMAAGPGSRDYSSFSVLCSSVYTIRPLLELKGAAFYPVPRVDSSAVVLEKRADVAVDEYPPLFYPLVRALFSSRRKTVKNNLEGFIKGRMRAADLLEKAGISATSRAEELGSEDFLRLARLLEG
jgi:16S rRNA (adenine1518-N6/adenine1519-N6)-dimethyltransferase